MRAWTRPQRGPPQTLQLTTLPTPSAPTEPSSTDILIRVTHVSLQANSALLMTLLPQLPFTGPWIPELELSGTVVAAGPNAPAELRPGTPVVAFQTIPRVVLLADGVLAEYIRLPGCQVVRVQDVDPAAASGLSGAGCTALKMLRTAGVTAGQSVLVNGASGSVGSVLVQLCKLRGARVVGVASGRNEDLVRGLGVDEFVDYTAHDLPTYLAQRHQFDVVMDCVGVQALYVHSPAYLKPDGVLVNVGAMEGMVSTMCRWGLNTFTPTWLGGVPRRYVMFSTPPRRDDVVYLARLVEDGQLRVLVDSVFGMEDVVRAYERVETRRARGKVVVRVSS